jgi:cytochrome bd-type quinol oxidase subunit 2
MRQILSESILEKITIITFFIAFFSLGAIYFKLHSSGEYTKDEYTNFRYFWLSVVLEYKKHTKKGQGKDIWLYYLFITSLMISVISFAILAITEIPKLVR